MSDTAAALLTSVHIALGTTGRLSEDTLHRLAAYLSAGQDAEEELATWREIAGMVTEAIAPAFPGKRPTSLAPMNFDAAIRQLIGRLNSAEARGYERGVREAAKVIDGWRKDAPATIEFDGFRFKAVERILALLPRTEGGGT